jgi:tRNA(Arg) A34 adenosine deaminase TadA
MIEKFELSLPRWAIDELKRLPTHLKTIEEQMREVIRFSKLNIDHETGGPFAAGVFEIESGRIVTIGVNRVINHRCSSAHAEVMALSLAQQSLNHFDLGSGHLPEHRLVVNWRPCAMCYGAVVWSGVRALVIAGAGSELEEITGFDEGPIHPQWRLELEQRGIEVTEDILGAEAIKVFHQFRDSGALVYNGRSGNE